MSECKNCIEYDTDKNYCPKFCEVIKHTSEDLRIQGAMEFAEYLRKYMCKENCGERICVDDMDKCIWYLYVGSALAEWQKGAENE